MQLKQLNVANAVLHIAILVPAVPKSKTASTQMKEKRKQKTSPTTRLLKRTTEELPLEAAGGYNTQQRLKIHGADTL